MDGQLPTGQAVDPPRLRVVPSVAPAAAWDDFAQRCRASFRSSYRGGRAWQLEHHGLHRLRRLEVRRATDRGDEQVGQCAVGIGRRDRVFGDALQLLPGHGPLWPAAMAAVLDHLGPGSYVYGSHWSLEPPRESALAGTPGVAVGRVEATAVDAIEFARWPTWADYLRDVSGNVRRNLKRAAATRPELRLVDAAAGWAKYRHYAAAVRLRRALFDRKGVGRSTANMLVRSAVRLFWMRDYTRMAYLLAGDTVVASHVGIGFGPNVYYLEGAAAPRPPGLGWHLLMSRIELAYRQTNGTGTFVLGSDDGTQAGTPAWEGLRRSRRQCCATPTPTSVVRFTFAGATARPADGDPQPVVPRPAQSAIAASAYAARRSIPGSSR